MVTLMQPRDLEMKQTLFIALFQPDPQCKLTIGHLWLFCATVGRAPSYFKPSKIQKYNIYNVSMYTKRTM